MALLQGGLAFAVMLGTIVAAMAVNARVDSAIEQSRQLVMHANARGEAVRHVAEALRDVQIGERGFLLTGAEPYLAPYWHGLAQLDAALDHLDDLVAGMPTLRDDVQALSSLARADANEATRVIALARDRGRDEAAAEMQATAGEFQMEEARRRAAEMRRRIGVDHEARLAEVRANEALASRAGVATAAVCAVLLGIAVLVLLRGRARLQQTQNELSAQSSHLSGTIAQMRDGIAVFASTGGLLHWNTQFAELVQPAYGKLRAGTSIEQLTASAWQSDPPPSPLPGMPTLREIVVGARIYEIWRGRMADDGQILVAADITRRSRAEMIARQAQKMEALGQLTGGVAHDFNNLLQVISANLELIGAGGTATLAARRTAALAAVARASQLTRHLLAFARRQPLTPEAIDCADLLGGLEDMLCRALGEAIELVVRPEPGLWPIRADQQQLENAILNLAINARDAMEGRGRLTIAAGNVTLDEDAAGRIAELAAGDYVALTIIDTGVGMSDEQLGRALEPFYTTKPEGRGTGLGLPMVFGFAKQSQGHLQLSSTPGVGTTARLYLPRSRTVPLPRPAQGGSPHLGNGELVLVVEDEATVRTAACHALHRLGYRTVQAWSAASALELLRGGLRPQLLFTDLVMPGQPDARTMAQQAAALIPQLAVVYTSGHAVDSLLIDGRLDPGLVLVGKPWRTADLARALCQALQAVPEAAAAAVGADGRLRIVLAEDDAQLRMSTAALLVDFGHQVTTAATGAAAFDAVRGPTDLLITDVGLPDMDGLALARSAAQIWPGLPVVVASGRPPDPDSPYVWLQKPFRAATLRTAIGTAIGRVVAQAPDRVAISQAHP